MADEEAPAQGQGSVEYVERKSSEPPPPADSGWGSTATRGIYEIKKKEGFIYLEVTLNSVEGVRFGLGIKHYNDQVIVSKAEKGSICGSQLKVLDHIVEVNGIPVTDSDVCREMLIKSMQNTDTVSMVVERPVNDDAIASMKGFLEAACKRSAPVSPVKKPPDATVPEMKTAIERRDRNNLIKRENERRSKSQTGAFKENSVLDNSNERHSSQRKRSSIKGKHENADRSTDREKRAAEILMRRKKSSRLLGKFGSKRKSEIRG